MARLVFGMNQSLDGYVDHDRFAPDPVLFRHFIEEAEGQTEEAEDNAQQLQLFHVAVLPQFLIPRDQIRAAAVSSSEQKTEGESDEKKRGRNKKRPRDAKEKDEDKLCLAVARGEPCPFGDNCKFDHDIKTWLQNKPAVKRDVLWKRASWELATWNAHRCA